MIGINTSGFVNSWRRSERKERCCVAAGSFGPNWPSRASASCAVKPTIAALVSPVPVCIGTTLVGESLRFFKKTRGKGPKDSTANMSYVSHSARLDCCH